MPKISDLVEQETGERIGLPGESPESEDIAPERPRIDLSWLRAETGPGSIDEYIEHPLNLHRSRGIAQALRGATGLLGELRLAIVDLGFGILNYAKERGQAHANGQAADTLSR